MKKIVFVSLIAGLFLAAYAGATKQNQNRQFNWNKAYFFNFYGVSPIENGDVWIVGSKGMICAYTAKTGEWQSQESGFSRNLYDVTFKDADNGWVVGQNGTIIHTENGGTLWSTQKCDTNEHLFGVSFADKYKGWAVGAYGTILITEDAGKTWEFQGDQVDRIYNDVCFVDKTHGWVVGEFGAIIHTNDGGQTWHEQENPLGEKTLFSVSFKDRKNGFASGMDGAVLQTKDGGKTWVIIDSKTKENLFSVTAKGENQWAVGLKGTFAAQVNGVWRQASEKIPTRAWLKTCAFVDDKNGWIVGSVGTVLHTIDGGQTWTTVGRNN